MHQKVKRLNLQPKLKKHMKLIKPRNRMKMRSLKSGWNRDNLKALV